VRVKQLAATFAVSEATIYNWLKQDRIDKGEIEGVTSDQALELAAARRRIKQLETELAVARKVNEVFSIRTWPQSLFPVISSLTGQGINVRHACRVLGVSESGYYAWIDRPDPPRTLRRIWLAGEIADVHKASAGTYGANRVRAELLHGREIRVGRNAVQLIMRELGIKGLPTRRLPKGARVAKVMSLDLVRREFRRDAPNELWMTDITEHPTREGKLYCAVVLDAFSRLVVGWSIDSTQTTTLVLKRARDGHGTPPASRRARDSLRPRRSVHLLGLQPAGPRCGHRAVDGCRRQPL
jgi:putative transposase